MELIFILLGFFLPLQALGMSRINGYANKLLVSHHLREYADPGICRRDAKCIPLPNATCFGTPLPYASTSIALAEDSLSLHEVQDNLVLWQGLRSVPRCWAVVQPLLCAVYLPKCENDSVFLPSQEMCRITRGPCKSVEINHSWPAFLRCENKKLFPPRCRNPLIEVKFNTSSKCVAPLVETNDPDSFFHEVEGCGIQCMNPFFTQEEHDVTHNIICVCALLCFVSHLFTIVTFRIGGKEVIKEHKYPGLAIYYLNVCLMLVSIFWFVQFYPGLREAIVCWHDGTIRRKQPRAIDYCSVTFALNYYFLMASIVWFVIFTYAWYVLSRQTGTPRDVQEKIAYFHISAWTIPFILVTVVMGISEVDGDSLTGICFVGYTNMYIRLGFICLPVLLAGVIGGSFFICVLEKGQIALKRVKQNSGVAENNAVKKIYSIVFKIGMLLACFVVLIICTSACHIYDFMSRKEWEESLREFIVCLALNAANPYSELLPKCSLKSKPDIHFIRFHICCLFLYGILSSFWVWRRATVELWKSYLSLLFSYIPCIQSPPQQREQKKKVVKEKAFQVQREISQGFNPDSGVAEVTFSPQQYSSASDVSRHISIDSFNQPNLDSVSMEQEYYAYAQRPQRRKTFKERQKFMRFVPVSRRSSDTSLQSTWMAASYAAAAQKARVAKITKATSTGDLEVPLFSDSSMLPPSMFLPVVNRPQVQRPPVNPPFTHGMTDNSHQLSSRIPSVASAAAAASVNQRFSPNQCSAMPNPMMGLVSPSFYPPTFNIPGSYPYGYAGMYSGMFPGYPMFGGDYSYNYGSLPYVQYGSQCQHNIPPAQVAPDSASEAEFFPIIMSDSDYTDTGHRSYDESQLLTAQLRLTQMQEQLQSRTSQQPELPVPKPVLKPQACAKTQFLQRMGSFNSKTNTETAQASQSLTQRKRPCRPPPSPVELSKGSNDDELDDDVFDDPDKIIDDLSSAPLPHVSDQSIFQKIKSKFRRAASVIQNLDDPSTVELTPMCHHSSIGQLHQANSVSENPPPKKFLKEKLLHESEGHGLMNNAACENVSR